MSNYSNNTIDIQHQVEQNVVGSTDNILNSSNNDSHLNISDDNIDFNTHTSHDDSNSEDDFNDPFYLYDNSDVVHHDFGIEENGNEDEMFSSTEEELKNLLSQIENDENFKVLLEFYNQIQQMHTTHEQYVNLLQTRVLKSSAYYQYLPKSLSGLNNYISRKCESLIPKRYKEIGQDKIPYISICDAITLWLFSPSIRDQLLMCTQKYTTPFLSSLSILESKCNDSRNSNSYSEFWTGSEWYNILLKSFNLWHSNYVQACNENIQVIFLHLIFYNDEFGWMGTGKSELKQIMYALTAGEFNHGQRKSKSIVNLPILLSKAKYNRESPQILLGIFTDELKELSIGKKFSILQDDFFVIALVHAIVGDIPARKSLVGMKESVSSTLPCHFCKVSSVDMTKIITHSECCLYKRRMHEFSSLKKLDSGTAAPELMNICYNVVKVSELNQWPVQINPECILNDLMHQKYLGDYAQHFLEFIKEVSRVNNTSGSNLWPVIQSHYSSYCKLNKIHSYTKIKNPQSWKGLKAYGIRRFSEFAPYLFLKMGWITNSHLRELFNIFCAHTQIILGLSQHSLSANQLSKIELLIEKQLHFFSLEENYTNSRCFITLNTHLDLHWIEMIKSYGVPRSYWCFVFEGMIKDLKRYFRNVNNKQVSWSVFNRHTTKGVMKLLGERIASSDPLLAPENHVHLANSTNNEFFSTTLQVYQDNQIEWLKDLLIKEIVVKYTKIYVDQYVQISQTNYKSLCHIGIVKKFLKDQNGSIYVAYQLPREENEVEVIYDGLILVHTFSRTVLSDTLCITNITNIMKPCYIMDWNNDLFMIINQNILH
jgi:hypothetical protein